jgi:hypothetical protein
LTTWTNAAGAVVSLALIGGIGVWGYDLMMRDVSGIPVVRAATTEMRVRPEDPGGLLAEHQGLAVNEIAARGAASGPVDQVVLAPPAVSLAEEDQPVIKRTAPVLQPAPLASADAAFDSDDLATEPVTEAAVQAVPDISERIQQGEIDDVVAALMAEDPATPQQDGAKVVQARDKAAEIGSLTAQPAVLRSEETTPVLNAPGVRQSMRPRSRPAVAGSALREASFTPPAETREIDPGAIPSGTRLAQLGAFDSADVARAEWSRMQAKFGDILEGKSRVVQMAESNGRTFYRLRAMGFVDLNDARRFCSAFKAEGVDCIPVAVK